MHSELSSEAHELDCVFSCRSDVCTLEQSDQIKENPSYLQCIRYGFLSTCVDTTYALHLWYTWHTWYTAAVPDIGYMKDELQWNEGFLGLRIVDRSWSSERMYLVRTSMKLQQVLSG